MKKKTTKKVVKTAAKIKDVAIPGKQAVNKTASKLVVVAVLPAKKGKWLITKDTTKKTNNHYTSLVCRNGNVLGSNKGFNNIQSAKKNIAAVKASA